MSNVTDVIFTCHGIDEGNGNFDRLNLIIETEKVCLPLRKLPRDATCGSKYLTDVICVGCFNYFHPDSLVAVIQRIKWKETDAVQLFVKNEQDDRFIDALLKARMAEPLDKYRSQFRAAPLQRLIADAKRWQYVRDNLTEVTESMADGTHAFQFRAPRKRAATIERAIDLSLEGIAE